MQKMHILVSIGLLTHTGPTVNVGWAPAAARMRAPRAGASSHHRVRHARFASSLRRASRYPVGLGSAGAGASVRTSPPWLSL